MLSAYMPIEFEGETWAVMAEIDQAEVLEPVAKLRGYLLRAGIGMVIVTMGVVFAAALVPTS